MSARCLLSQPPALAQVKTSEITFKSGDDEVKAFVAMPDGKGPFPAIVVIQEWWGLNDWIKENAKRLAGKGYVAIAPDLYRGKVADDMKTAAILSKGLPPERCSRISRRPLMPWRECRTSGKEKIGSIGWCMGGKYSLQLCSTIHASTPA